tara:strand:- start:319 stop:489 length:171 start_codon:yes stop_codon:yes gene_type:complete
MRKTKKIRPFDEQDTKLAMGKTVKQQAKTDVLNMVKTLTKQNKHVEAQALFKESFK